MSFDFNTVFPGEFFVMFAIALIATFPGFFRYRSFRGFGFYLTLIAESIYLFPSCLGIRMKNGIISFFGALLLISVIVYALFNIVSDYMRTKLGITDEENRGERAKFGKSFFTWIFSSLLYASLFTPVLYRAKGMSSYTVTMIGCSVAVFLLLLLIIGQSSRDLKDGKADKFPMTGFHRFVRYPKELFTIVFWIAFFLLLFKFALNDLQLFILPLISQIVMIVLQIKDLKKQEAQDDVTYGDDEDYRSYVTYTPLLIPLLPWNTLQKKHPWEPDPEPVAVPVPETKNDEE